MAASRNTGHGRLDRGSTPRLIIAALAYLSCHAAAILGFPPHAGQALSFAFLIAAPLLACLACALHGRRRGAARGRWNALGLGLLLWAGGMTVAMADALFRAKPGAETALSMLLYVLYAVPLTWVLAGEAHEDRIVRVLDAAMALALGALFAAHTLAFSDLSGTDAGGVAHLRLMFDVENLFVAAFALLRWFASDDAQGRRFFRVLARFAVTYMAVAAYINHVDTSSYGQLVDLLIDLPFLLLAIDALRRDRAARTARATATMARVVRTASPLILPVSLVVVSALIARHNVTLAVAGFATATLCYGARSVRVQLRASRERERLDALARIDALTGLANRRQFDAALDGEWNRARRSARWLSLVLIDIDHFKRLNDEHGHHAGDDCLRQVARSLQACATRGGDLVARYGGEEFAAILPDTDPGDAARIAEAMRASVERLPAPSAGLVARTTISLGVASIERASGNDASILARAADQALYQAKRDGRNRVASTTLST